MEQQQNRYRYFDNEQDGLHLHTYEMSPLLGTSTVVQVISKSAPLMWWALQIGLGTLGFVPPRRKEGAKYVANDKETRLNGAKLGLESIKVCTPSEYLDKLDKAYVAHNTKKEEAAEAGVDLHYELEKFVIDEMNNSENMSYPSKIQPFIDWAADNVKRFLYSEMHCYSTTLWCGGISDAAYEKHDGTLGIIDFKSSKSDYASQYIQIAGYALQIEENGGYDKDGNKMFSLEEGQKFTEYSVLPFGMDKPEVQTRKDIEALKEGFKACVTLHKLTNY